ncbi:hypothetical protein MRX96_019036 [Rhipicephalus microplus]
MWRPQQPGRACSHPHQAVYRGAGFVSGAASRPRDDMASREQMVPVFDGAKLSAHMSHSYMDLSRTRHDKQTTPQCPRCKSAVYLQHRLSDESRGCADYLSKCCRQGETRTKFTTMFLHILAE